MSNRGRGAWQREGCSSDGGTNVLGQRPLSHSHLKQTEVSQQQSQPDYDGGSAARNRSSATNGRNHYGNEGGGFEKKEAKKRDFTLPPKELRREAKRTTQQSLETLIATMQKRHDRGREMAGKESSTFGLKELRKKFQLFDDGYDMTDGSEQGRMDNKLTWEEFRSGIDNQQGFRPASEKLSEAEIFDLFCNSDYDGSGEVSVDEFLDTILRTQVPPECIALLENIFSTMDKSSNNEIDVSEIKSYYDVTQHPKFKSGEMSEDEVLINYIKRFEPAFLDKGGKFVANQKDGKISKEEWLDYYGGVYKDYEASYGTACKSYFLTLLKSAYRKAVNTAPKKSKESANPKI